MREERYVQELVLDIDIRVDSNGTQYFCRVVEGNFTAESENITINVGGNVWFGNKQVSCYYMSMKGILRVLDSGRWSEGGRYTPSITSDK